jgi:glycosyltransferase involved in cell wall biosynthesis
MKTARPFSSLRLWLVQPSLMPPGGGNAVAVWMAEALKKMYRLSILTWKPPDLAVVNTFYGTDLQPGDFQLHTVPKMWRSLVELDRDPFSIQKHCSLMRYAKLLRKPGEPAICAHNEMDLGAPCIQYIHYPWMSRHFHEPERGDAAHLASANRPRLRWSGSHARNRLRPWRLISGFSYERMRNNITLVNSQWIGNLYQRIYQTPAKVVYPPVGQCFPVVPWSQRENGFVCVGRISPEKRLGRLIDILAAVRAAGEPIHLHLVGTAGSARFEQDYYREVKAKTAACADWIYWEENCSRAQLAELLSGHRYGIHRMQEEHFGIAVAEFVAAHAVVFAHNSGGPAEILEDFPELMFMDEEEAVSKILTVLRNAGLQESLSTKLASAANRFSADRFMQEIQALVASTFYPSPVHS